MVQDKDDKMHSVNVIYATGALRKFLDARAKGAPRELLVQLSTESLAELEAERLASEPAPTSNSGVVIEFADHLAARVKVSNRDA
jgi:hypothetical protein